MAEINLNIHGKSYGISCDDGQEDRVIEVGEYVDSCARNIASAGAASNENHLLVLTALVLADEVKELRDSLQNRPPESPAEPSAPPPIVHEGLPEAEERQIIESIETLARRINSVAKRMNVS